MALNEVLLPNYFMFDSTISRSEKVLQFERKEMLAYLSVKKSMLKLLYVCFKYSKFEPQELCSFFMEAALAELLTGVDSTVLNFKEVQTIPLEYLRQVCCLPPGDLTEATGEDVDGGSEAFIERNAELMNIY